MVNGPKMAIEMAREPKFGKMAVSTLVTGKMIKQSVKADLFMLMVTYTKESGLMTRPKDEVYMNTWMVQSMLVTGKKTDNMVMV